MCLWQTKRASRALFKREKGGSSYATCVFNACFLQCGVACCDELHVRPPSHTRAWRVERRSHFPPLHLFVLSFNYALTVFATNKKKKEGKRQLKEAAFIVFFFSFLFFPARAFTLVWIHFRRHASYPCACLRLFFARNTHTDEEVRAQAHIAGVTAALNTQIHTLAANDKAHMKVRKKKRSIPVCVFNHSRGKRSVRGSAVFRWLGQLLC